MILAKSVMYIVDMVICRAFVGGVLVSLHIFVCVCVYVHVCVFAYHCSVQDITTVGLVQCKENLNNLVVTSFQTSDEDPSHTHTYSLVTNPSNKFKIVGSRLMTTATSNLNYELQSSYTIVVLSKGLWQTLLSPIQHYQ